MGWMILLIIMFWFASGGSFFRFMFLVALVIVGSAWGYSADKKRHQKPKMPEDDATENKWLWYYARCQAWENLRKKELEPPHKPLTPYNARDPFSKREWKKYNKEYEIWLKQKEYWDTVDSGK